MKAKDFDQKFDQGQEDIIEDLDLSQMRRPNHEVKKVNVDFPLWMVNALDKEANRLGISRQSVIKVWIADHLKQKYS